MLVQMKYLPSSNEFIATQLLNLRSCRNFCCTALVIQAYKSTFVCKEEVLIFCPWHQIFFFTQKSLTAVISFNSLETWRTISSENLSPLIRFEWIQMRGRHHLKRFCVALISIAVWHFINNINPNSIICIIEICQLSKVKAIKLSYIIALQDPTTTLILSLQVRRTFSKIFWIAMDFDFSITYNHFS